MRNSLEDSISFGQISVPKVTQRASEWVPVGLWYSCPPTVSPVCFLSEMQGGAELMSSQGTQGNGNGGKPGHRHTDGLC